ncbi:MAG: hypothetical protein AAB389_00815 [Patescibacteria group bacterium]
MTSKELRIAGAMLYVGEGTKLRKDPRYKNTFIYAIELTNSDPQIVALFIKFLKEELEVDFSKVRGQLFIYPDLDKEKVMRVWSRKTGIPIAQFQKVIMLKPRSLVFRHSPLGTFKVRISSKDKFLKLQSIIESVWKSV